MLSDAVIISLACAVACLSLVGLVGLVLFEITAPPYENEQPPGGALDPLLICPHRGSTAPGPLQSTATTTGDPDE